jgi:release factor glutamine methyltransferase
MNTPHAVTWTIGELLQWTTDFFKRSGVDEPRLSSELLLAHALNCNRMALYTRYEQTPPSEQVAVFREMVKKRKDGTPVAYLIGQAWFFSLDFVVSSDVLIPRPDTETLVEQAIRLVRTGCDSASPRILDLCTGSGCIGVALAKNITAAQVVAVDLSDKALAIARQNAQTHGVADRVLLVQGDLFEPIAALIPPVRFGLVISNPPYIPSGQIARLMPEVHRHEPRLALDGGPDGMDFHRRIAAGAGEFLLPGGALMMETAFDQAANVEKIVAATEWYENIRTIRDAAGHQRCVLGQKMT